MTDREPLGVYVFCRFLIYKLDKNSYSNNFSNSLKFLITPNISFILALNIDFCALCEDILLQNLKRFDQMRLYNNQG